MSNQPRHLLDSDPAWQSHGESNASPPPPWPQASKLWQRLAQGLKSAKPGLPNERTSGEMTTLPGASRGQLLREAHRGLRDVLRQQRALRRVLPHLYFVERALARRGSMALMDVPVLVLQRALQQIDRVPPSSEDGGLSLSHLHLLRYRLAEAIGLRSRHLNGGSKGAQDSFNGTLDTLPSSRGGLSTLPGGLDVTEVPHALFDELTDDRHRTSNETKTSRR